MTEKELAYICAGLSTLAGKLYSLSKDERKPSPSLLQEIADAIMMDVEKLFMLISTDEVLIERGMER